jgi:hypothetical protein
MGGSASSSNARGQAAAAAGTGSRAAWVEQANGSIIGWGTPLIFPAAPGLQVMIIV